MLIREALRIYPQKLLSVYSKDESSSITELVLMHHLNMNKSSLLANFGQQLTNQQLENIDISFNRLATAEPVQYVLGETMFCNLKFKLDSRVLIPRPETEELVTWIIEEEKLIQPINILDIGSGSGCIPVTLKKILPFANVTSIDVSSGALEVAAENTIINQADVNYYCIDIFNSANSIIDKMAFDVIVSNPPYVLSSEQQQMHKNVVKFEPHTALFVNDNNPLIFYERIADFALDHLNHKGRLYFEINENMGASIIHLLKKKNFSNILLKNDFYEKPRMIRCEFN